MSVNVFPERVVALERYGETGILYSQFTDGEGAAGTYQVQFQLPVDFRILRCDIVNVTGFSGDTTAVVTVGDGSDADRLNTGTPSILSTATALQMGVPSGSEVVTTAFYPTITVTGASDWGNVSAGQLDIYVVGYMVD